MRIRESRDEIVNGNLLCENCRVIKEKPVCRLAFRSVPPEIFPYEIFLKKAERPLSCRI